MAKQGDWVRIHRVILPAAERTANLPEDTRKVPFEMWVKGHLLEDGEIGDEVRIKTVSGREEHGTLIEVNPQFDVNFGSFVPEVLEMDVRLRTALFGKEAE
ncbi:MAG: 2-amino-4-ketopentanoate thiolase [Clostridia bacterium]|nr:2-amino-4-ketopentanoate thiolase [Clostridia bacterium]